MQNPKYTISFFNSNRDKLPKQKDLSFEEILDYFNKAVKKKFVSKDRLEAIICGTFIKNERTTEALTCRSIVTYDIDNYQYDLDTLITSVTECLKNNTYIYYTTASSTFANPRLRILLFINNPVARTDYNRISEKIAKDLFNEDILVYLDRSSYSPMQLMYLPCKVNKDFRSGKNIAGLVDISKYMCLDEVSTSEDNFSLDYKKQPLPNIDDTRIREILNQYNVEETDYHEWFKVCQALNHQYSSGEKGLELFIEWSLKDSRYDKDDIEREATFKYKSVRRDCQNPITFASIIHIVNDKKKDLLNNLNFDYLAPHNKFSMSEWIHVTGEKKLKPVNSDENFSQLIEAYGFNIYHNVILKDIVCEYQNSIYQYDAIIGKIDSIMNVNSFPARNVNTRIISYAHDKYKNPWADWVLSKKWDGIPRIEEFYNSVEVRPEHENIKRLYLRKWIMQMLHISCFNNDVKAKQARAVLVFQGKDEGKQKTAWLNNLAPPHFQNYVVTGKQGTINNDMNIKDIISCVMCELGELDGMFKKSDISALKNFLSRFEDSLNRKYEKSHSIYRRRTAFFATVNKVDFLSGEEQNTRFWVVPVLKCNAYYQIDLQQLYAEFIEKYIKDIWWLDDKEQLELINSNKFFGTICPIIEMFTNNFNIAIEDKEKYVWMNCTEALQSSFYKGNINRKDISTLRKYFDDNYKYNTKKGKWLIPPLKSDKNIK